MKVGMSAELGRLLEMLVGFFSSEHKTFDFLVPPGSTGEVVEHGRPSVPQTECHGDCSCSTGQSTTVVAITN